MKKRNLFLTLTYNIIMFGSIIGMEQPPQPPKLQQQKQTPSVAPQTYLDKLSPDTKGELLNYVKLGKGILNIPAFAQATMAMGDIKDPHKLLDILQSMPTKAASRHLAEKLQAMSAMKESKVQEWLTGIKFERGAELFELVSSDNSDPRIVVTMLENPNIDLNWKNNGETPLMKASFKGHSLIVRFLLNAGADVNAKDYGSSALSNASYNGKAFIIMLLLNAGADANLTNSVGHTPLMQASHFGYTEIVRRLLGAGAKVNAKLDFFCETALIMASAMGHKEAVKLLLAAGADANMKNNRGQTARGLAIENGGTIIDGRSHKDVSKLLEQAEKAQANKHK